MDGFVSPSEDVYLIGEMHDTTLGELLLDRQVPMEVSEVQMVAFYLFRGLNVKKTHIYHLCLFICLLFVIAPSLIRAHSP